jgi:hypothetical protein
MTLGRVGVCFAQNAALLQALCDQAQYVVIGISTDDARPAVEAALKPHRNYEIVRMTTTRHGDFGKLDAFISGDEQLNAQLAGYGIIHPSWVVGGQ